MHICTFCGRETNEPWPADEAWAGQGFSFGPGDPLCRGCWERAACTAAIPGLAAAILEAAKELGLPAELDESGVSSSRYVSVAVFDDEEFEVDRLEIRISDHNNGQGYDLDFRPTGDGYADGLLLEKAKAALRRFAEENREYL